MAIFTTILSIVNIFCNYSNPNKIVPIFMRQEYDKDYWKNEPYF
jgi:hypothetical protein